jgi:predicted transcriptional regulator
MWKRFAVDGTINVFFFFVLTRNTIGWNILISIQVTLNESVAKYSKQYNNFSQRLCFFTKRPTTNN